MAPRPDVSDERRKEILDAAARVFNRKGFAAARVDDIAAESGISKGLLYWYFKGKDAVIVALLRSLLAPESRRLKKLASGDGSATQRLGQVVDQVVREFAAFSRMLPLTFEFYALAFRNRSVSTVVREFFAVYTTSVAEVIRQGIAAGEFLAGDPSRMALSFGAVLEGTVLLWVFDRDSVDLEEQIREGAATFLRGISTDPSKG
jgi:AcrR family transcriptional regulator